MFGLENLFAAGMLLAVLGSLYLLTIMRMSPRVFLRSYPQNVRNRVAPATPDEKRLTGIAGIPFWFLLVGIPLLSAWALKQQNPGNIGFISLFLNAFGVLFISNLVDLLLVDWLVVCTITPKFLVLPGTEGMADYKNFSPHVRGFVIGTMASVVLGSAIAAVIFYT